MIKRLLLAIALATTYSLSAETPLEVKGELFGNVGSGDFAPYYMMSNNGGVLTQSKTFAARASVKKDLDLSKRFSYSFGVDALAGASSSTDYIRYSADTNDWVANPQKPASAWTQQLYGEIKYRGVFLTVGMKERTSPLLNAELGSGDFIQSNNARPLPEVRAGFVDFQNVPFTKGWLQVQGEIAFGKYIQDNWLEDHYGQYNKFINKGVWSHYKRMYLRSNPNKPFSVTVGMQAAAQFGGTVYNYQKGNLTSVDPYDVKLKDFWRIFTLRSGDDNENFGDKQYVYGNTLGSWDFVARYRLKNKAEVKAYFQWPFEDGSGIGKLNGFDGIWGLEYDSKNDDAIVSGAVFEYIDFTNQSGPNHWAPNDNPDSEMAGEATGSDDYYNNFRYNSFMNLGMSQGTPFIRSTIYNLDGYQQVLDNRIRGFHLGVSGRIYKPLKYRLLFSYRKSWGTYSSPRTSLAENTSLMIEGIYDFRQVKGLTVKGQVAFDKGDLLGDNFGVLLSISYKGLFDIFGK